MIATLWLVADSCLITRYLASYLYYMEQYYANYTIYGEMPSWLMHWIPNQGVPFSKPLGGSKVDSAFHLSEVDKISTRNFWELSGKK